MRDLIPKSYRVPRLSAGGLQEGGFKFTGAYSKADGMGKGFERGKKIKRSMLGSTIPLELFGWQRKSGEKISRRDLSRG